MPAEGLSYLEQVRSRREARGLPQERTGKVLWSAAGNMHLAFMGRWEEPLLMVGGQRSSGGRAAPGSWTLFSGEGRRGQSQEPERGREGGGAGREEGGGAEEAVETGEEGEGEKERDRERQERKLIKGCSPQTGKRLGRKRPGDWDSQTSKIRRESGILMICHFVWHFRWQWCWGASCEWRRITIGIFCEFVNLNSGSGTFGISQARERRGSWPSE